MRVRDSKLAKDINHSKSDKNGNYYFFDDFIVAEIHEGITYSYEASEDIVNFAYDFYGSDHCICYITNRVNNYKVSPSDWIKYINSENKLNGYAVISYNEPSWINTTLEKMFLNNKIKRFNSIYDAAEWAVEKNKQAKLC